MRPSLRPPWPTHKQLLQWHPRALQRIPCRIATTSAANPAPVDIPKLQIAPGSLSHNSLKSFLEYAKRTNLAPHTTYWVGTHYEYTTALCLMRLGFSLLRIGRRDDAGIDLIGHWVLAPLREPLRVIVQCKSRRVSVNPCNIRELEGSFQGIPPDWRDKDVLGLLVTTNKATKGTMEAIGQSRWPMGFVLASRDGTIQQFVWNRAAADRGLEGVGVTMRHTPRALLSDSEVNAIDDAETADEPFRPVNKRRAKFKNTGTKKEIQMTWMGSPIFPERDTLDAETLKLMRHIEPDLQEDSDQQEERVSVKAEEGRGRGRPRTQHMPPTPRGGLIKVSSKRGRPKGSKNKPKVAID